MTLLLNCYAYRSDLFDFVFQFEKVINEKHAKYVEISSEHNISRRLNCFDNLMVKSVAVI